WPAHRSTRIATGAHQIDIALAIDLSATQKERVDSALRGKIEQFDAAAGEKIVFRRAEQGDAHRPDGLRAGQQCARAWYWRCRADRDMRTTLQQARDDRDQKLGPAEFAHAAASSPPSQWPRNCAMPSALRANPM